MSHKLAAVSAFALTLLGALAIVLPADAGAAPKCTIVGTEGRDWLHGTPGRDVICGRGGADEISGGKGNDRISGDAGNDILRGGPGRDELLGGSGRDTCADGGSTVRRSCEPRPVPKGPHPPVRPTCCTIVPPADLEPPMQLWLSFTRPYVDTSELEPQVELAVEAWDESGTSSIAVEISGPGGVWRQLSFAGNAGPQTAVQVPIVVPESTPSGDYEVTRLTLTDGKGNSVSRNATQLAAAGSKARFAVFHGPDEVAPELTDFAISPTELNPEDGPANVELTIGASDSLSGVEDVTAMVVGPDWEGPLVFGAFDGKSELVAGTRFDGTWRRQVTLPADAIPGYYRVRAVYLRDVAGHIESLGSQALRQAGFLTDFLLNGAAPDTSPPEIVDFSFDRTTIDASAEEEIEVTIHVRDDLSGFYEEWPNPTLSEIGLEVEPDFPWTEYGWGGRGLLLESGSLLDGVWSRTIRLNEDSPAGTYVIPEIWARDRAGNKTTLSAAELQARGWPHSFVNAP